MLRCIIAYLGKALTVIIALLRFEYKIFVSVLMGNAKALSTVTAIIDGTGSIGKIDFRHLKKKFYSYYYLPLSVFAKSGVRTLETL